MQTGGINAANTKIQREAGIEDSAGLYARYYERWKKC